MMSGKIFSFRSASLISPGPATSHASESAPGLKISAFKDITAFVLEQMSDNPDMPVTVKYVKDATEAHGDLKHQKADLVFTSYDDTLSIALQENHPGIVAVMPVHGGILDLCGRINPEAGNTKIGIDTDSGYARALRQYLRSAYSTEDFAKLQFTYAGATNLRYELLVKGEIDATLLNPPYSFVTGIARIHRLEDTFGAYQGVVANTNRAWLKDDKNSTKLKQFSRLYYKTVNRIKNDRAGSITRMQAFYDIPAEQASLAFDRLWQSDGLSLDSAFDKKALQSTQQIFMIDTGIQIDRNETFTFALGP